MRLPHKRAYMGDQQLLRRLSLVLPLTQLFPKHISTSICIHWWSFVLSSCLHCACGNACHTSVWYPSLSPLWRIFPNPVVDWGILRKREMADYPRSRHLFRMGHGIPVRRICGRHCAVVPEKEESRKCNCCVGVRIWWTDLFPRDPKHDRSPRSWLG